MKNLYLFGALLLAGSAAFAQDALSGQPAGTTTATTLVTIAGKKVNIQTSSDTQEGLIRIATPAEIAAGTPGTAVDPAGLATALAPLAAVSTLADGNIFVGNASSVPVGVPVSGEATLVNTGAITLSNDAVIAKTLTAYPATPVAGTVTSADSVFGAIQKLDGNIQASVAGRTFAKEVFDGVAVFDLGFTPADPTGINFYVNGVLIPAAAISVAGDIVTYTAASNFNYVLVAGDSITIAYFH